MFIAREKELKILDSKILSDQFEFGIIYGRRRIGKTSLLQEVVKNMEQSIMSLMKWVWNIT